MVRKPSQLRQIVGEAAGKRSGSRRRASAAVASFGAAVVLLAGCGGSEQDTNDAENLMKLDAGDFNKRRSKAMRGGQ